MLPENLRDFLAITLLDEGEPFFGDLFDRKFGHPVPDHPIHIGVFYKAAADQFLPVCYIHFIEQGDLLLGGGACVDDRVLRRMPVEARAAIRAAGGLYQHALAWSVRNLGPQTKAIFGFCGDVLAERADLAVGFKHTLHPKLLVYFTQDLEQHERDRLIAEAHAVGPF